MSTDASGAAVAARGCYWESGGREWIRILSADGSRWNPTDPGDTGNTAAAQESATALTPVYGVDPARIVLNRRAPNGRWARSGSDEYPPTPGGRLIVELTGAELAALAAGSQPPAVRQRITRAIAAGVPAPGTFTDELDRRCRVSTRGRHGLGGVRAGQSTPATPAVALAALIRPNGEKYHPRPVEAVADVDMIRTAHAEGMSVLFHGPPGTGKTAALEAAFTDQSTGAALFRYVAGTSDTEVSDLIGTYVPEPGGSYRWIDGPLLTAMEDGVPLIMDEIALIDPRVLSILYAAMDGRRECYVTANPARGTVRAAEGFGVHGACNPDAPGAAMSEALISRMSVLVEYGTDYGLAAALGVPARLITGARNLERKRIAGELVWSPQMRELLTFKRTAGLFGETFALRNLIGSAPAMERAAVADVISGAIGRPLSTLIVDEGVR